jgi:predicted ribosome quality control (RQC) complex YloA/Tae2 family protein
VRDITVQPYERIVSLTWERPGTSAPAFTLIHELLGPHANIMLVDAAGIIVDALKQVAPNASHRRAVFPGEPYVPPPLAPQRWQLAQLTLEQLQSLCTDGRLDGSQLQRRLLGVSPALVTTLLSHSQGDPQICWEVLQSLRQRYESQTLTVTICTTAEGVQHLSVLPGATPGTTIQSFDRAQEAVAAFYEPAMLSGLVDSLQHELQTALRQRQRKLHTKLEHLQQDYEKLQSYLPYQNYGTLLVAQRVPRGTTSTTVVDYYCPEPRMLTIPLDPRLSGQENAQAYFKKYRKAKSGLEKVQHFIQQCTAEAQRLEHLAQRSEQATDWQTLQRLTEELRGDASVTADRSNSAKKPPLAQPYRTFVSRDGYTFYCGKSDAGNDLLVRQLAAPSDVWLHAHQQAGAHVLIKVAPQQEVPRRTLLEAAALAAYYSKGKQAAAVEVIYTQARHVQKFRGARPGQVRVQTYRTLEVAPRLPDGGQKDTG